MSKLFITIGLPGSGKSTWAKKQSEDKNVVIVSRDSYRSMIKGGDYVFDKMYEALIKNSCYDFVVNSLCAGLDVVLDETNLTVKKREEIVLDVRSRVDTPVEVHIVFFQLSERVCLENRMKDPRGYDYNKWQEIISNMVNSLECPKDGEVDKYHYIQGVDS